MDLLDLVCRSVERKAPDHIALSDRVWETPELNYEERQSSRLHAEMLRRNGFTVSEGTAGLPTALLGEAGTSGPVIAFLGEYDALPALSQQAGRAERMPVAHGANGHGCGHNMLGAASLLAAAALGDCLREAGLEGRVRYVGCPAEEGGSGKSFLVKAGLFDDVDAALCWHPSAFTGLIEANSLACLEAEFAFEGRASHAAMAPQDGRSALDAVELMNVGVNYLREHMPVSARVHYAVVDTGGTAPNVVQPHARVRYIVRGATLEEMWSLFARVCEVARGAATMTETSVTWKQLSGEANLVGNPTLEALMLDTLTHLGAPPFDDEDRVFAAEIGRTFPDGQIDRDYRRNGLCRRDGEVLCTEVSPRQPHVQGYGSTDVGTVSWVVPTVQCKVACYAAGTPGHSWQLVAQGKSGAAHKGLVHAAKAMAGLAFRLLAEPSQLDRAKADHEDFASRETFRNPVSGVTDPPYASQ